MRKTKLLIAVFALLFGVLASRAANDITANYLTNADLSTVNTGWTYFSDAFKYTDWKTDGDVPVVEFYSQWNSGAAQAIDQKDFKFSQTITIPAGYYRLAVNAFYRNGGGDGTNDNKAWIFVKGSNIDKSQNVAALTAAGVQAYSGSKDIYKAANAFSKGDFSNAFDFHLTDETEVEVGFQGFFNLSLSWCILGPVKLYEYTAADYQGDFDAKKVEAEALYDKIMNATVLSELKAAANATFSTVDEITAGVQTLTEKIAAANLSISNYSNLKVEIDKKANAVSTWPSNAKSVYESGAADAIAAYNNRTATDGAAEIKALQTAYDNAVKSIEQPEDGFDMTAYIVNPGIDGNVDGWTCDINSNGGYAGGPLKPSNDAMEFWGASTLDAAAAGKTFDYYQTLTALPEGAYTISADMLNSTNGEDGANWNDGGKAGLYGKTASAEVQKLITTDGEAFLPYTTDEILVVDGELRIGVKNIAALTGRWFAADNFKLTYVRQLTDEEKEVIAKANAVASYEEALAAAKAIENGTIPAALYTDLQGVITANTLADGTSTEYNTATAALKAATDEVTPLVAPYIAWKAMKSSAEALVAIANDNNEANSTLSSAIGTQNTATEAATTANDINAATSTLKTAMATYCNAANPVGDGAKFDMTFMLTNPDLSVFKSNGPQAGWFTDQTFDTQNSQVMQSNNAVANSEDNTKFAMYEYWSDASCATSGYTVYTKINLPEGTYQMKALCMTGWGWHASQENGMRNITFSAGDVDGTSIVTSTLETAQLDFVQTSAGEVKIGLKAHEGNTCNWMGIGYVQLFKVPAVTVTIDEDVAYTPESKAGKVTLKRTLSTEKWNTFVVPFQITNEELKAAFGDEVAVAEYSENSDDAEAATVSFTTMGEPAITANKPVLLKPSSVTNDNTYVFQNRTVATGEAKAAGKFFDFVGTYAPMTIAEGDYFIQTDKLWKRNSTKEITIKGTRAYIKAKEVGANIANFFIDGIETTAVEAVEIAGAKSNGKIYNLNGQEVKSAQKGIYIQNGKKVIK